MDHDSHAAPDKWLGRPWLSRGVRFAVYAVPFVCSILAALALSEAIPLADGWPLAIGRVIAIAAGSTIVLYAADRLTRRALPLAALLGLTLVFPDEAPSRFKIAMRAGGTTELSRRLADYRRIGAHEPAIAATRVLELVADLSRHDRLTRGHSERVRAYSQMIGEELGLSESEIDSLRWAALLHDIGKLEVPFEILNKPGSLTEEEFDVVRKHPGIGAKLAAPLAGWLGASVRAVGEHHERWDGKGYPNGLRGPDIALAARIVAVADTFDVMTSVRSYKKPGTPAEARAELARCAGTQFDANVVRAFLNISLGKLRLAMGPLSWLTQLAFFPARIAAATSAAPALMAAAGMTAAALGTAAGPGTAPQHEGHRPSAAVAAASTTIDVDHTTITVSVPNTEPRSTTPATGTRSTADIVDIVDTTSATTTTVAPSTSTATNQPLPTRVTIGIGGPVDQTVPVIGGATRPPVTTTSAPPTTPAATPTPTATPTTAAPTTPPTTAPPTTTVAAPGTARYLLASSAAGNVASQSVLPLVTRAPLNATLPNLDVDRDAEAGRLLRRDSLLALGTTDHIQRFRLDPSGKIVMNGPANFVLYAAAKQLKLERVQAQAALVDCLDGGLCAVFATRTVNFTGVNGFTPITFDFGAQTRTIAASHDLELWIIVTTASDHDMFMAYDTTGFESALTITG
ncbi:MAG TPA: HD-GYP domain-containing protein [Ilumatobacteraceae bacterium]